MGPTTPPHVRVKVWARGGAEESGNAAFDFVVELDNTGDRVVTLDLEMLDLEAVTSTNARVPPAQLARPRLFAPSASVWPGTTRVVGVRFLLPEGFVATDLAAVKLRWAIAHADGQLYVQHTRFKQVCDAIEKTVLYYDPVWHYYDPFLYGAPFYGYHARYGVPVGRVHVRDEQTSLR